MTALTNKWLTENCNFRKHHRSQLPVPCLGDRYYETDFYYFEFERDKEGYHSCVKLGKIDSESDYTDVVVENRRPDGSLQGGVNIGTVSTVEDVTELIAMLKKLEVSPEDRAAEYAQN